MKCSACNDARKIRIPPRHADDNSVIPEHFVRCGKCAIERRIGNALKFIALILLAVVLLPVPGAVRGMDSVVRISAIAFVGLVVVVLLLFLFAPGWLSLFAVFGAAK